MIVPDLERTRAAVQKAEQNLRLAEAILAAAQVKLEEARSRLGEATQEDWNHRGLAYLLKHPEYAARVREIVTLSRVTWATELDEAVSKDFDGSCLVSCRRLSEEAGCANVWEGYGAQGALDLFDRLNYG